MGTTPGQEQLAGAEEAEYLNSHAFSLLTSWVLTCDDRGNHLQCVRTYNKFLDITADMCFDVSGNHTGNCSMHSLLP